MRKYEIYTIKCEDCCKPDCKKRQHINTKIYCLDFIRSDLLDDTTRRSLKLKNQKQDRDGDILDKMLSMTCYYIVKIARWFKKISSYLKASQQDHVLPLRSEGGSDLISAG